MYIASETYKARRIVVSDSLGITPGLKYRVSLHNTVLKGPLLFNYGRIVTRTAASSHHSKVGNNFLCVLSFSSSRFTTVDETNNK